MDDTKSGPVIMVEDGRIGMPLNPDLVGFVKESLERSVPRRDIEETLTGVGWPPDQIRLALARFADAAGYPIPVPRPSNSVKPREAFLYAVMFAALLSAPSTWERCCSASSTWLSRIRTTRRRSARATASGGPCRWWWLRARFPCTSPP